MGKIYILLAAFIFGVAGAFSKVLFNYELSPVTLTALRSMIAFLTLGVFIGFIERTQLKINKQQVKYLFFLGLLLTLVNVFFYLSIAYTNVAVAITLEYTSPILILFYGFFFQKKPLSVQK